VNENDWLTSADPLRLSPDEIERETQRLLGVYAREGVAAIDWNAFTSRELLRSVADACHRAGLREAAQYLSYLDLPYD
jgi:hypothetical protein